MKLEITDMDIIGSGTNTLISALGAMLITQAHYAPETLTNPAPAVGGAFGMLMILVGLGYGVVMRE